MPRGVARYRELVAKARAAALEAVAAYNNPVASFKSGTYVVLMHVAWTALFHAIFWRRRIRPHYRRTGSTRFEYIDGRPKTWDLSQCVHQYWGGGDNAVAQNLRFFIGLRNVVEHADAPEIDFDLFGECQAMLINFDDMIAVEFGERFALNTSLAFSLQFARIRRPESQMAMKSVLRSAAATDIRAYIDKFRSALSGDILGDMTYSFKVFLLPVTGNHRTRETLPIEFIPYDPNSDEYDQAISMIKQRLVSVLNLNVLRPSHVVERVAIKIAPKRFTMNTHIRSWKYYKVRPPSNSENPVDCKTEYCQFDWAHGDYLYSEKWVDHLVTELSDDDTYGRVSTYPVRAEAELNGA
jgi:hypothetical protein